MLKNYMYIISKTMIGGFSNSLNRLMVNTLPLYSFLFFRYLLTSIVAIFSFKERSRFKKEFFLVFKDSILFKQMLFSCFIHATGIILFYHALKSLPVSIVSIYENGLYTLFTILLAVLVLKEKQSKVIFIFFPLCLVGLFFIVTKGKFEIPDISLIGLLFLSLNALLSSVNTTIEIFNLKKLSPQTITFFKGFTSSLVMIPMIMVSNEKIGLFFTLMTFQLLLLFTYGVFSSYLSKYLYLRSLQTISSSKTALFQLLTPIMSCVFALIIFNESLNIYQIIGILLIVYSLYKLK